MEIKFKPIGILHTPFKETTGIPRQAAGAKDVKGELEVFPEYSPGLKDLQDFSHIVIVFNFHKVIAPSLKAHPPWDDKSHGVFATRSPYRPNPIGVSVVKLESVKDNILHITGIDMADGTPVLDIKPYIPDLNPEGKIRLGWLENKVNGMNKSRSGDR